MNANPRNPLLLEMKELNQDGVSCAGCSGVCCTFVANSMQLTPNEAETLVNNLKEKGLLTPALRERCRETIKTFGLDRPLPGTGSRNLLRRRYTCPLFQHKSLGCPLDAEAKPFGCLAFNPSLPNTTEGKGCRSNTGLLEQIDQELKESEPFLDKVTIPQAILAFPG